MNIDLDSQFQFGDAAGLKMFMLTHKFVHDQIALFAQAKYGSSFSGYGLMSPFAEAAWEELMKGERTENIPPALQDWLQLHAILHDEEYALIVGVSSIGQPDLSLVNFSDQQQFYDWMYVHQQLHDIEQGILGFK
jgi:hypothetical protein